jgi:hypothetical protein
MTRSNAKSIRLTDAQLVVLSQAVQRDDRRVAPPAHLKGAALSRVMTPLVSKGLIAEEQLRPERAGAEADALYVITDAGLGALGIEPDTNTDPAVAGAGQNDKRGERAGDAGDGPNRMATPSLIAGAADHVGEVGTPPRAGSKLATVVALLTRPEGASIEALMAATGWLSHTTRAALTGLRKRGMMVIRDKVANGSSRYRVGEAGAGTVIDAEAPAPADAGDVQAGRKDVASTASGQTACDISASAISDDRVAA